MIVEIEDLNKGDEVMIALNAEFRRIRLLRQPKENPKKQWGRWSAVMCEILNVTNLSDYTVEREMYQDLGWRQMWLLKRANK